MRKWCALATLVAMPVAASDFGNRYPAGSISDGVQAQIVLKEAEVEMARIAQSAKARDVECLRRVLVNSCRDDVRREKELAEREVGRVRVEARDVQRRIEAERVAKRRSDDEAAREAEDALRPQKESEARDAVKARKPASAPRDLATKSVKPAHSDQVHRREPDRSQPPPRLTAEERAKNEREFQQKQEQAQKRAQEQEVKRKENEQRRAEKRKQIEEQEAAREEIRKKAAESLK